MFFMENLYDMTEILKQQKVVIFYFRICESPTLFHSPPFYQFWTQQFRAILNYGLKTPWIP